MDSKLAEYRAKRRRQELIDTTKATVQKFFAAGVKEKDEDATTGEMYIPEERQVSESYCFKYFRNISIVTCYNVLGCI
jgi:hypothetical protein